MTKKKTLKKRVTYKEFDDFDFMAEVSQQEIQNSSKQIVSNRNHQSFVQKNDKSNNDVANESYIGLLADNR